MRLDSANRSFLAFMGVALLLGAFVICGAVGGVLLPLVSVRLSHDGLASLLSAGGSALAALLPFGVLVAVGLALGCRSLVRQAIASCRLARRLRGLSVRLPEELVGAAAQTGLDGRVVFVEAPESFSFVYGVLTPRVVVSRGLLERVTRGELRAVLEHERYHVCNLDPLKVLLVQALSAALFFLPALDSLRARYAAGRELAADRRALVACGRRPLVNALLKVVRGPEWSELEGTVAIGGPELLDVRVAQLETGAEPRLEALSLTRIMLSLLGAALFAAAFLVSVSGFGGPAAVYHATGTGLVSAILLGGSACAAPFAVVGFSAYSCVALRARRPRRTSVCS
jgi:Zn-dependent protease with chaperone function